MRNLLLIFLGAAYLENLVLLKFFDAAMGAPKQSARGILLVAGVLLALTAALNGLPLASWQLPPQALAYLHALVFVTTAMTLAQGDGGGAMPASQARLRRLRIHLPLLVANLAVLLFALLDERQTHGWVETTWFCLVASAGLQATVVLLPALRERLEEADVPKTLRGAPIAVLSACLIALALMGCVASLQW